MTSPHATPLRIGIGGPVGSGKTALVDALCKRLRDAYRLAVVTNDSRVVTGDVYDLCVVGTVTSPLVLEKPGIDPNGFHGAFWVAPRDVLELVGPLDESFQGAFYEDDDYLERLRRAGIPTRQIASVQVWSRRIGLTMSKSGIFFG